MAKGEIQLKAVMEPAQQSEHHGPIDTVYYRSTLKFTSNRNSY